VVFDLSDEDARELDTGQTRAGYRQEQVTVADPAGAPHAVITYGASPDMIDPSQLPFASYKDPIVRAARDNGLPSAYVETLERLPVSAE
jgi:AIG2 family protein